MLSIRKSNPNDLPVLHDIYEHARQEMKKNGNPTQWITYPEDELIEEDIRAGRSYVVEANGYVCATFVFFIGEEPDYMQIDGQWLNFEPYGVIHRIASDNTEKGILSFVVEHCYSIIPNLKMDTHKNNKIMQHLLEKEGFYLCGTIYIVDDISDYSPRMAYQKTNM